jgi:hypothetical protein
MIFGIRLLWWGVKPKGSKVAGGGWRVTRAGLLAMPIIGVHLADFD